MLFKYGAGTGTDLSSLSSAASGSRRRRPAGPIASCASHSIASVSREGEDPPARQDADAHAGTPTSSS